jgi:hypothetical protein
VTDGLRYVIRRNDRQGGVTLSLRGSWGNLRYTDPDTALAAVKANARGAAHSVERQGC